MANELDLFVELKKSAEKSRVVSFYVYSLVILVLVLFLVYTQYASSRAYGEISEDLEAAKEEIGILKDSLDNAQLEAEENMKKFLAGIETSKQEFNETIEETRKEVGLDKLKAIARIEDMALDNRRRIHELESERNN